MDAGIRLSKASMGVFLSDVLDSSFFEQVDEIADIVDDVTVVNDPCDMDMGVAMA